RLLLGDDRPEDQAEEQKQEPEAEISRYGRQWCLSHGEISVDVNIRTFEQQCRALIVQRRDRRAIARASRNEKREHAADRAVYGGTSTVRTPSDPRAGAH